MRSVREFIVEPFGGKLYDNVKVVGGVEIVQNTNIEAHSATNRQATVVSVPANYNGPIEDGALVVVHHNVFRKYYNAKGKESFASTILRDNMYTAADVEVFAYKNDWAQDWIPIEPYCFVEPIKNDDESSNLSEKPLHGVMKYSNDYLKSKGIVPGAVIGFENDSEYEFNLDGIKLYRMKSKAICLVL